MKRKQNKKTTFSSKYCAVWAKIPNKAFMSCWGTSNYIYAAQAASCAGKAQDFPKQKM